MSTEIRCCYSSNGDIESDCIGVRRPSGDNDDDDDDDGDD